MDQSSESSVENVQFFDNFDDENSNGTNEDKKSKVTPNYKEEISLNHDDKPNNTPTNQANTNYRDSNEWYRPRNDSFYKELYGEYPTCELYYEYEFPPKFASSSTPWLGIPKDLNPLAPKDNRLDEFMKKIQAEVAARPQRRPKQKRFKKFKNF